MDELALAGASIPAPFMLPAPDQAAVSAPILASVSTSSVTWTSPRQRTGESPLCSIQAQVSEELPRFY